PHPFHAAPASGAVEDEDVAPTPQNALFAIASSGALYEPAGRPVTNSDTARRSAGVSVAPCRRMLNALSAVSTWSGVSRRTASRPGIRGIVPSWQEAQCCL